MLPQGKSDAPHAGNAVNAHRMASEETVLSMNDCARPNGSRLSCGALKKDSFLNLRAPSASSAC